MHYHYEIECVSGLADVVQIELQSIQPDAKILYQEKDALLVDSGVDVEALLTLKSAISVYAVATFDIPRPKALLGHENFHQLVDFIHRTTAVFGQEAFSSMYLSAAGSGSSVMTRLKREISQHTHLKLAEDEGDLLLRLRPTTHPYRQGWDALVRLTPRPLATRSWRTCNLPGALNASVAHAMVRWMLPQPADVVVNLACGSGTLLIERILHASARYAIGVDNQRDILNCASENIQSLRSADSAIELIQADIRQTPLSDASCDALCADLPFGNLVGSHRENVQLYPALLHEAARIARPNARFVVITHEVNLMNDLLDTSAKWRCIEQRMIVLSGLHPRIFILERT